MEMRKGIFDKLEKPTINGIEFVVFLWQTCCASVGAYILDFYRLLTDEHYFVTVIFSYMSSVLVAVIF